MHYFKLFQVHVHVYSEIAVGDLVNYSGYEAIDYYCMPSLTCNLRDHSYVRAYKTIDITRRDLINDMRL